MILRIHIAFGIFLLVVYGYVFTNLGDYFPGLKAAGEIRHPRASAGYWVIVLLPFIVSVCFIFPDWLSRMFSPKFGLFQEALFNKYGFIFLGYLILITELSLLQLFK